MPPSGPRTLVTLAQPISSARSTSPTHISDTVRNYSGPTCSCCSLMLPSPCFPSHSAITENLRHWVTGLARRMPQKPAHHFPQCPLRAAKYSELLKQGVCPREFSPLWFLLSVFITWDSVPFGQSPVPLKWGPSDLERCQEMSQKPSSCREQDLNKVYHHLTPL